MHNLKLIIKREYLARVRNKTFIVMTFVSPLIFVGMILFIAYLTSLNSGRQKVVGVNDESGLFVQDLKSSEDVEFEDISQLSLADAKKLVREKHYYGLLHIPKSEIIDQPGEILFFAKEVPGFGFVGQIEKTISEKLTNRELQAQGVDLAALKSAQTRVDIQVQDFSGERTSKMSNYIKMFFGAAAGYLLMMFIIIYGNMVMRSVIEEKTNRIVEIIISSVKPIHLMLGKILGTSLAGLTQFIIWVVLGGILLFGLSMFTGVDMAANPSSQEALNQMSSAEINQIALDIYKLPLVSLVIYFFIYFLGGYFLYSSIYAAIGAAVDSETDTQQFMFPLIIPLMLGVYVGFFTVIENPHGTVSTIFSMIPLTSPIVMLMRIPFGVPWWELAISLSLLLLSVAGVIWMAAKIYRIGILMYGKKPNYKEIYKWLKY